MWVTHRQTDMTTYTDAIASKNITITNITKYYNFHIIKLKREVSLMEPRPPQMIKRHVDVTFQLK